MAGTSKFNQQDASLNLGDVKYFDYDQLSQANLIEGHNSLNQSTPNPLEEFFTINIIKHQKGEAKSPTFDVALKVTQQQMSIPKDEINGDPNSVVSGTRVITKNASVAQSLAIPLKNQFIANLQSNRKNKKESENVKRASQGTLTQSEQKNTPKSYEVIKNLLNSNDEQMQPAQPPLLDSQRESPLKLEPEDSVQTIKKASRIPIEYQQSPIEQIAEVQVSERPLKRDNTMPHEFVHSQNTTDLADYDQSVKSKRKKSMQQRQFQMTKLDGQSHSQSKMKTINKQESVQFSNDIRSKLRPSQASEKNQSRLSNSRANGVAQTKKPLKSNYESMSHSALHQLLLKKYPNIMEINRGHKGSNMGLRDTITTKEPPSNNFVSIDIHESVNFIKEASLDQQTGLMKQASYSNIDLETAENRQMEPALEMDSQYAKMKDTSFNEANNLIQVYYNDSDMMPADQRSKSSPNNSAETQVRFQNILLKTFERNGINGLTPLQLRLLKSKVVNKLTSPNLNNDMTDVLNNGESLALKKQFLEKDKRISNNHGQDQYRKVLYDVDEKKNQSSLQRFTQKQKPIVSQCSLYKNLISLKNRSNTAEQQYKQDSIIHTTSKWNTVMNRSAEGSQTNDSLAKDGNTQQIFIKNHDKYFSTITEINNESHEVSRLLPQSTTQTNRPTTKEQTNAKSTFQIIDQGHDQISVDFDVQNQQDQGGDELSEYEATLSELLKSSINSDEQVIDLVEEKQARIDHKQIGPLDFKGNWTDYTNSIKDKVNECKYTLNLRSYDKVKSKQKSLPVQRDQINDRIRKMRDQTNDRFGQFDRTDYLKTQQFSGDQLKAYFSEGVPGGKKELDELQREIDKFVVLIFSYWSNNKKYMNINQFIRNMVIFGLVPDNQFIKAVIDNLRVKISNQQPKPKLIKKCHGIINPHNIFANRYFIFNDKLCDQYCQPQCRVHKIELTHISLECFKDLTKLTRGCEQIQMILGSLLVQTDIQSTQSKSQEQPLGTYSSHIFSLSQMAHSLTQNYSVWQYQQLIEKLWTQLDPTNISGSDKLKTAKLKSFLQKQFQAFNGSKFNEVLSDEIMREALIKTWKGQCQTNHQSQTSVGASPRADQGLRQNDGSTLGENVDSDFECFESKAHVGKKNYLSIFRKAILHISIKNCLRLAAAQQEDNLEERRSLASARANLQKIGKHGQEQEEKKEINLDELFNYEYEKEHQNEHYIQQFQSQMLYQVFNHSQNQLAQKADTEQTGKQLQLGNRNLKSKSDSKMTDLMADAPQRKRTEQFYPMKMKIKDAISKMSFYAKQANPQIKVRDVRAFSEEKIMEVNKRKLKFMADRRNKARKKVLQLGLELADFDFSNEDILNRLDSSS